MIELPLTPLRAGSVLLGIISLAVAFWQLRGHRPGRLDTWALIATGVAALLVGVFPDTVLVLADVVSLGKFQGSRLIMLLILVVAVQWYLILSSIGKLEKLRNQFDQSLRRSALDNLFRSLHDPPAPGAILVAIPALNEAENLKHVVPSIPRTIDTRTVIPLVINDGSTDDTEQVAAAAGALVASWSVNVGGGAALRVAYDAAAQFAAGILVTLDGDGQHDSGQISMLVGPILRDEADLVIGSRILGSFERDSVVRLLGVRLFSRLINLLMGSHITDCSSGFRAIRVSALKQLKLTQDQYHTAELIIEASKHKLRIVERPIFIRRRLSGVSKKGRNLFYGFMFMRTLVKTWLR